MRQDLRHAKAPFAHVGIDVCDPRGGKGNAGRIANFDNYMTG